MVRVRLWIQHLILLPNQIHCKSNAVKNYSTRTVQVEVTDTPEVLSSLFTERFNTLQELQEQLIIVFRPAIESYFSLEQYTIVDSSPSYQILYNFFMASSCDVFKFEL